MIEALPCAERRPGEHFVDTVRRVGLEPFKALASERAEPKVA
jgi:sulfite reductase beta subunit-like hemoprotein